MDSCAWCDKEAVNLCDAPIAIKAVGCYRDEHYNVTGLMSGSDESGRIIMWTCDTPLCSEHSKIMGQISGTLSDNICECPYHASQERPEHKELIIFENELSERRRIVQAGIRTMIMRENNKIVPA